jgi:hypothetical protein
MRARVLTLSHEFALLFDVRQQGSGGKKLISREKEEEGVTHMPLIEMVIFGLIST